MNTIETIPTDGSIILAWHIIWKAWFPIKQLNNGQWTQVNYSTIWPIEAFSHWMEMPEEPNIEKESLFLVSLEAIGQDNNIQKGNHFITIDTDELTQSDIELIKENFCKKVSRITSIYDPENCMVTFIYKLNGKI